MKIKKLILPVMLFLMFMPFMVNAETCDLNKITIDSVTIKEKTNNVTEVEQPVIDGKKIKVNLKMMEVNDSIEYKLVVKNDSSEDYELDKNSLNANLDYIEYTLKTDDDSLVVKAGKSKDIYLKVKYKNEVPNSSFIDGKFNDNKSFVLSLSNGQTIEVPDTIKNPKTGDGLVFLLLICMLCVGITMYMVLSRKKLNKFMVLLLSLMITIPVSVYALCKIEITVESNVTIEKGYPVNYIIYDTIKTSEKSNYNILDFSKFGVNEKSCRTVDGKDGYEFCAIIESTEIHSPGDIVTMPNEITYHAFNGNGDLIENTVPMNNTRQSNIWDYWFNENTVSADVFDIYYWWAYNKDLNNYDDVNDMNFTGNVDNQWSNSEWPAINIYAPNSFTMPHHGVFFGWGEALFK